MKKIITLSIFILCSFISFAQLEIGVIKKKTLIGQCKSGLFLIGKTEMSEDSIYSLTYSDSQYEKITSYESITIGSIEDYRSLRSLFFKVIEEKPVDKFTVRINNEIYLVSHTKIMGMSCAVLTNPKNNAFHAFSNFEVKRIFKEI